MAGGHYEAAIPLFRRLEANYPFGTYAAQAQMEIAYAHYKAQDQAEALAFLQEQPWPGNVRQLENVVRQALLQARPLPVSLEHVTKAFGNRPAPASSRRFSGRPAGRHRRPRRRSIHRRCRLR